MTTSDTPTNHEEAEQLAILKYGESNLARCYVALRGEINALRDNLAASADILNQTKRELAEKDAALVVLVEASKLDGVLEDILEVADTEGMDDLTTIPIWPKGNEMLHEPLSVGAIRKLGNAVATLPESAKQAAKVIEAWEAHRRNFTEGCSGRDSLQKDGCYCSYCDAVREMKG